MASETVSLRIICVNPPAGTFGLQAKSGEIVAGERLADGRLRFAFDLQAKQTDTGQPNFTGSYAHGSVKERFLYLTLQTQEGSAIRIVKRIKVHLKTITWAQVESVLARPGALLEVAVDGRGAASVPLFGGGWVVQMVSE